MTGTAGSSGDDDQEPKLRSGRSIVHSFVRFTNQTSRRADIVWMNYEGVGVKYKTLNPGQFVDVNTFAGHPWLFRDTDTGDKLAVQSQMQEVYLPVGWPIPEDGWPPQRRRVTIMIPVYPLKERCMQVLRRHLRKESVDDLDLPWTLKRDLKSHIH